SIFMANYLFCIADKNEIKNYLIVSSAGDMNAHYEDSNTCLVFIIARVSPSHSAGEIIHYFYQQQHREQRSLAGRRWDEVIFGAYAPQ
ncbi:hypothetical protein L9F63_019014, partial [Diploptera punctata]